LADASALGSFIQFAVKPFAKFKFDLYWLFGFGRAHHFFSCAAGGAGRGRQWVYGFSGSWYFPVRQLSEKASTTII
jgi:hypothetical protein